MTQRTASKRIKELDGLRGVAALIVAFHHAVLAASLAMAAAYTTGVHGALATALGDTPLRIVWAGHEAVLIFFALSGFALAWPYVHGTDFRAASYYPGRAVRLFLPVWAALALAALAHLAFDWSESGTWWLADHGVEVTVEGAAQNASLFRVSGTSGFPFFSAIWSLRWEALFSLVLPLYLWFGSRSRTVRVGVVVMSLASIALPSIGAYNFFMPIFMLGVVAAYEHAALEDLAKRFVTPALQVATSVAVACALTAPYWAPAPDGVLRAVAAFAAVILVVGVSTGTGSSFLMSRPVQWLGSRSFSLYLVHETVVVSTVFVLGTNSASWAAILVAIPMALLAAEAFFVAVERPSHRLAKRAGRRLPDTGSETDAADRSNRRERRRDVAG